MDRQRQMVAASGMTLGVMGIIAGILFWPKGELSAGAQGAPGAPGAPGGLKAGAGGPQMAQPGAAPGAGRPAGAAPAGGVQGAPGQAPPVVYRPPYTPRKDPFKLIWKIPPPPPYVFNEVQVIREASVAAVTPPPPNTEIREVPSRRVSGIMSGDGVFAILEGAGTEPEIVKPGSETRDGYKVISISADTVTLRKKEGNITYTQVVPLSDIPPGQQPQVGGAGRFGYPGGGPGGPSSAGSLSGPGFPGGRGGGGGSAGSAKE